MYVNAHKNAPIVTMELSGLQPYNFFLLKTGIIFQFLQNIGHILRQILGKYGINL